MVLKAWYSYNMAPDVKLMIQGSGVSLGLLIFLVLAQRLRKVRQDQPWTKAPGIRALVGHCYCGAVADWRCVPQHGFFRRQFKKEDCRRLSWDSPEAANLKQRTND